MQEDEEGAGEEAKLFHSRGLFQVTAVVMVGFWPRLNSNATPG